LTPLASGGGGGDARPRLDGHGARGALSALGSASVASSLFGDGLGPSAAGRGCCSGGDCDGGSTGALFGHDGDLYGLALFASDGALTGLLVVVDRVFPAVSSRSSLPSFCVLRRLT
jgi:hypothetical protein